MTKRFPSIVSFSKLAVAAAMGVQSWDGLGLGYQNSVAMLWVPQKNAADQYRPSPLILEDPCIHQKLT